MAIIDSTLVEIEGVVQNANTCKDLVINRLLQDEKISKEEAEIYMTEWNFICIKRKWYQRWFDKFFPGDDKNQYVYRLVKFT